MTDKRKQMGMTKREIREILHPTLNKNSLPKGTFFVSIPIIYLLDTWIQDYQWLIKRLQKDKERGQVSFSGVRQAFEGRVTLAIVGFFQAEDAWVLHALQLIQEVAAL